MCRARQSVTAHCSVVTTALNHAPKPALHARKCVVTTANTGTAERNVVTHVILVPRDVLGSASIADARNCVGSCVIARDVTCHAQSYFGAGIPVLDSAGKYAQSCAVNVTRTETSLLFLEQKVGQMQDSWSWQTVVTCLKLK